MNVSNGSATVFQYFPLSLSVVIGLTTFRSWFVSLTTTAGFSSWFSINLTYTFFRQSITHFSSRLTTQYFLGRGMIAQGFDLKKNAYNNRLQPYLAYWGVFWTLIFILFNGYAVFWAFTASGFLTACMFLSTMFPSLHGWLSNLSSLDLNIPIFVFLYLGYKIVFRTKIWKPTEMDLVTVSTRWWP